MENRPLVKFIRNYIRGSSGVFSISSLVRISMTSCLAFTLLFVQKHSCLYNKKKIPQRLEDMNFVFISFIFSYFYHSKIKFISSRRRVISSLYNYDLKLCLVIRDFTDFNCLFRFPIGLVKLEKIKSPIQFLLRVAQVCLFLRKEITGQNS